MSKRYYTLLLFFLWIGVSASVIEFWLQLFVGQRMILYETYPGWYIVNSIIYFAIIFLTLKYYWYKRWKFVTATATLALIAQVAATIVFFSLLEFRKLGAFHKPSVLAVASTSLLLGFSLFFVKQKWLRVFAVLQVIVALLILSAATGEATRNIILIIIFLSPIPLILHFIKERTRTEINGEHLLTGELVSYASLLFTVIFGILMIKEYFQSSYWDKKNYEKAQALVQKFESGVYVSAHGDSLRYKLLRPLNYDSSKNYPLVVTLPTGGQPATDLVRQTENAIGAEELSSEEYRRKYPAFIFIPHCPPGGGWGGVAGAYSVDTLVYGAIESLQGINENRRYVIGLSRGGYGAWNFICKRPDLFAAAIPICGAGDPAMAPRAAGVAVWAFHGRHDKNVPVAGSRNMIAALQQAGGHPKYTEYAKEAHNIGYRTLTTPGLWDWLFAQQKQ